MKVDWETITKAKAAKLLPQAVKFRQKQAERYNNNEVPEQELLNACEQEDNLNVFYLTGLKPGEQDTR